VAAGGIGNSAHSWLKRRIAGEDSASDIDGIVRSEGLTPVASPRCPD
jgi:hypothetical protein